MSCFARRFRYASPTPIRHTDRERHAHARYKSPTKSPHIGPLPQVTIGLHSSHRNLGAGTTVRMPQGAAHELYENISRPAAVVHFASASHRLRWRRRQIATAHSSQSIHRSVHVR